MKILLATGNDRKLGEARLACDDFGIEVEQIKLNIDEIQHHDVIEISRHKASEAFKKAGRPVTVTDTSWKIPALNGFPGGYMKEVSGWFEPEDFISLIKSKEDKRICFVETIIYTDDKITKIFSKEYWGEITDNPRGDGESVEQVAMFDGYTIAERHNHGKFSHDPKDYIWYEFADWFKDYNN
jgi:non-canonical purine NTP pyrophosphatase (RdgB/HAM1 family)